MNKTNAGTWESACRDKCAELAEVLIGKQYDYGKDNINDFGQFGILVRMNDKFARWKNLAEKGTEAVNDPLSDTKMVISGYGILSLMLEDGTFGLPYGEKE